MKKIILIFFVLIVVFLLGCTNTVYKCTDTKYRYQCNDGNLKEDFNDCPKTYCIKSCPSTDCGTCPVKTETKTLEKNISKYVCVNEQIVDNLEDCFSKSENGLNITINSYEIKNHIESSLLDETAEEGYEFHIFDVRIENTAVKNMTSISFKIKDDAGYSYQEDIGTAVFFKDFFDHENIALHDFSRGKLIFQAKKENTINKMIVTIYIPYEGFREFIINI